MRWLTSGRLLVAALAVAILAPAGCADDEPGAGEARLDVDGVAVVERGDERERVQGSIDLQRGDRVEVTEGVGQLQLSGGVRMELRAGIDDADNSVLAMDVVPVLEAGDMLVSASGETTVEAAGTTMTIAAGAAQVSRRLGVGIAAYDADVVLDSAGQERVVPALREMQVPALGRPPREPRPVLYDEGDPWDRRFLGAAIELGERLQALANGYTANLDPGEGRTPGFFRVVLPGLEDESAFDVDLLSAVGATSARPPGETLVGAAITDLGRQDSFAQRWSEVFRFRDEGAEWGIVALDQAVSSEPLLGSVEQAVGSSPLTFVDEEAAPPPDASPPAGSVDDPPVTTPASPPSSSPAEPPTSTTTPPTTTPPSTDPTLAPALDPVVDPLTGLVEGLVGGLLGGLALP